MSKTKLSIHVTVSSSGTYNVNVSPNTFPSVTPPIPRLSYVFSGSATAPYTIAPTGSPDKDTFVEIVWNANLTVGASALQIFGANIPNELIASKFIAECLYDGAAWIVTVRPSFDEVGIIGEDRLAAKSVTLAKMASGTTGSILAYNLSGDIEEVNMATDGKLLIGVTGGKGYNAAVLSGDATLSTVGVLSLASGSVDTAELVNASVTTDKIEDAAVTAAKLDSNSNKAQITIPISFEDASELGVLEFKMCFDCTVDAIHGTVTKPFVSTGTHIFKDDTGTVLTGSQIDMSSALTLGNIVSTTPTANNSFSAGDVIKIETSTSGAVGGKSVIVLCCTKV
jgi:hypothetical protein